MEEKYSLKKDNLAVLIIICLLAVINIVVAIWTIADVMNVNVVITKAATIVMAIATMYYAVSGYKVPHGNLMKYLFVLYAASIGYTTIARIILFPQNLSALTETISIITIICASFMAGRLYKFKENIVFIIIVAVLAIINIGPIYSSSPINPNTGDASAVFVVLSSFNKLFTWAALSLAYITRFKAHKEAGMLDKAEHGTK